MKIILQLLCVGSIFVLFGACTITKRHSGPGYHVEWKKNWKEATGSTAQKQEAASDTLYAQANPVSKSDAQETHSSKKERKAANSETSSGNENDVPVVHESATPTNAGSQDGIITDESEAVREEVKNDLSGDVTKPEVKRKVEPLTWVAFAFLMLALGVGLLPASLFSSLTLFIVIFSFLLFIAFINAVSSATRIKRNPDKYKAKPFTWLVLFFCSLGFAFALALIIFSILPVGAN